MAKSIEKWNSLNRTIVQFEKHPTQLRLETIEWADGSQWGRSAYNILLGIIRNHLLLNHLIKLYVAKSPKPSLHAYLLIGSYQLFENRNESDRLPKIVHHTVELVKRHCSPREGNFANVVLRKISNEMELNLKNLQDEKKWEIFYSHPKWLVRHWTRSLGEENTVNLLKWNQTPPKNYVHDYSKLLKQPSQSGLIEELKLSETKWDDFYQVSRSANEGLKLILAHPFYIQDPATAIAPSLAGNELEGKILDACAAPGGKTLLLKKLLADRNGTIYAVDKDSKRIKIIHENRERLGLEEIQVIEHDWVKDPKNPELPDDFDLALVDAPCSSTGIIGKHPEIRWRLRPSDFESMPKLQVQILQAVSKRIKIGGKLIYSTCSIEAEENAAVGKQFLETEEGLQFAWLTAQVSHPYSSGHDGAGAIIFERIK